MKRKDFLSIYALERRDIDGVIKRAVEFKKMLKRGENATTLKGKTVGLIFDKSSTRTRISFEVGIYQMGGMPIFLSRRDIQLGRGETIADTARVMSRYMDGVVIRTFGQEIVEEFAQNAGMFVINGLTDLLHPCQVLTDLVTIVESKGSYEGLTVAYIGDGNNMTNSWINAAAKLPFRLAIACPAGYEPDEEILKRGMEESEMGVALFKDPAKAVDGADVVYTDVWTSMGQEEEQEERVAAFDGYQVTSKLLEGAKGDAIVMHCLPAHRGEEIAADVIDGPRSVIFDEAENRLHTQKAVMDMLMGGNKGE